MKMIFFKKKDNGLMKIAFTVMMLALTGAVILLADGMTSYRSKYENLYLDNIRNAIYDTLITCYALEGSYPEELGYLAEHYGLIVNDNKFIYRYELTGANLFPDFEVVPFHERGSDPIVSIYDEEDQP